MQIQTYEISFLLHPVNLILIALPIHHMYYDLWTVLYSFIDIIA